MSAKHFAVSSLDTAIQQATEQTPDLMSLLLNKPLSVEHHAITLHEHSVVVSHPAPNQWKVTVTFTSKGHWVICKECGRQACYLSHWVTE